MAEEGTRGAALALSQIDDIGDYIAACQVGITMASIGIGALGEPAIAHLLEPLFGRPLGHGGGGRDLGGDRLPADHERAEHRSARSRPSSTRSSTPRAWRARIARPLQLVPGCVPPVHRRAQRGLELAAADARHRSRRRARGRHPRRAQADDRRVADGRQLDVGEANMLTGVFHLHEQEARQVMTPIPAVVTVDLSETVEDGAAPLRLDRPLAPGRDRGREPGPRQGHRPRQPARQADDERRATTRTSTSSCARRRSSPRPSRSTICWPTFSASGPSWRS